MPNYICVTCGTQFAAADSPPERCPICEDERQYVPPGGQEWTTLDALREDADAIVRIRPPAAAVAWDDRTSIIWATVVRGIMSTAIAVARRAASARMRSGLASG